jgi:hypothetical protein
MGDIREMDTVREVDTVLQHVRQFAQRFRIPSDAAITQQILLFSDAFYGYRFTMTDFTAIWSAADQILKVFDSEGRMLEAFLVPGHIDVTSGESTPLTSQNRAA